MSTDRFAAFRKRPLEEPDLFAAGLVPPCPTDRGTEKAAENRAVPPAPPVPPDISEAKQQGGSLTDYIIALMRHPNIDRADPEVAARHYGLRVDWCRHYLQQEKSRRASGR